jgi:hypothetical protein
MFVARIIRGFRNLLSKSGALTFNYEAFGTDKLLIAE